MMDIQEIQKRRHLWVVTVIPAKPWSDTWLYDTLWMKPVSAEITLERKKGQWVIDKLEARGAKYRDQDGEGFPVGPACVVYTEDIPCQFDEVIEWAIENAEKNWRKT